MKEISIVIFSLVDRVMAIERFDARVSAFQVEDRRVGLGMRLGG